MKNCAQYIAEGKDCLGRRTTDQQLGDELGFSQPSISQAKSGRMSDKMALALGKLLVKHKRIQYAGEVVLVAHAERDADPGVRSALLAYAGKVVGQVLAWFAGLAVTLALVLQPQPSLAADIGGEGR